MRDDDSPDTNELLCRAERGDDNAAQALLERHRERLRRMLAVRFDQRLAARIDPSDIIQEAMIVASQKLGDYLTTRPLPFYPWLRGIAYQRLIDQHRRHLEAKKRSVRCEAIPLPDESAMLLASQLIESRNNSSQQVARAEIGNRVRAALDRLDPADREILVLRHLEEMRVSEVAAMLNISQSAVKMRRLRAIERLRDLLDQPAGEAES